VIASVPLFDGMRSRGRVAQAEIELSRLRLEEQKLRESIGLQARLAVNAADEAAAIVTALGGTVKQAERLLFMAEKGYQFGVKTRLELLAYAIANRLIGRTALFPLGK